MIGGLQLSLCCDNPVPDADVPACPITSIVCSVQERSELTASNLVYVSGTFRSNHPGCTLAQDGRIVDWDIYELGGLGQGASFDIAAVSAMSAGWTESSESILTLNNGPIVRPNTNVVIATCLYRVKEKTFTLSNRLRNSTQGIVVSGIETRYVPEAGEYYDCCSSASVELEFNKFTQGSSVSSTPPAAVSHVIRWAGVCNQAVVGLTIARTGSSPGTDPWKIQVTGGQILLTNGSGTTTAYSGTLSSVRTAMNATGLFTVTASLLATANATTGDLLEMGPDYLRTGCPKQVLLADVGTPVSPGLPLSSGYGGQGYISNSYGTTYFNATATGFSNDKAGLEAFVRLTRYPKLSANGLTGVGAFEFSQLGLGSEWSTNSGASIRTENVNATPGSDVATEVVTITCNPECVPVTGTWFPACGYCEFQGMNPITSSFGPAPGIATESVSCPPDGTPSPRFGWSSCAGTIIDPPLCDACGTPIYDVYGCYYRDITTTQMPDRNFAHVRTLQGEMTFS
jgi:hypothetical protein